MRDSVAQNGQAEAVSLRPTHSVLFLNGIWILIVTSLMRLTQIFFLYKEQVFCTKNLPIAFIKNQENACILHLDYLEFRTFISFFSNSSLNETHLRTIQKIMCIVEWC